MLLMNGVIFAIFNYVKMSLDTIIQLENASIFQKHNLVLTNVSLRIDKGEFVYLLGKTGSGKSSLLKTLYADLDLIDGSGVVAGYDLKTIKLKEIPFLRRKLGIVFQDFQLLTDRTINENLMLCSKQLDGKTNRKCKSAFKMCSKKCISRPKDLKCLMNFRVVSNNAFQSHVLC